MKASLKNYSFNENDKNEMLFFFIELDKFLISLLICWGLDLI